MEVFMLCLGHWRGVVAAVASAASVVGCLEQAGAPGPVLLTCDHVLGLCPTRWATCAGPRVHGLWATSSTRCSWAPGVSPWGRPHCRGWRPRPPGSGSLATAPPRAQPSAGKSCIPAAFSFLDENPGTTRAPLAAPLCPPRHQGLLSPRKAPATARLAGGKRRWAWLLWLPEPGSGTWAWSPAVPASSWVPALRGSQPSTWCLGPAAEEGRAGWPRGGAWRTLSWGPRGPERGL